MLRKVAFTMYPVTDMARARAFYEETLGLGPSRSGATSPWVEFDLPGGGCLAITTVTQQEPSANAGGTIAFEVDDLPALVAGPQGQGHFRSRRRHRKPGLPDGGLPRSRRQFDHPPQAEEPGRTPGMSRLSWPD
jgi:catechol 2,3-dioxygenase-like lactoylglutathione lyase family enzyme